MTSPATTGRPGRPSVSRAIILAAILVAGLLPMAGGLPAAVVAGTVNPKVVIVSGPAGSANSHYKADADALAAEARKFTTNVIEIKTPKATWTAVKAAAQGAAIFIYLGHGNGWPSVYRDSLWPFSQNGLGLDPPTGADGSAHVYYGEANVASDIRLAPNAVVLLFHLCYASGNTEPGLVTGSLLDKEARVENYAAGFFAAGARAVIADASHPNITYIDRLFSSTNRSMLALFRGMPTYHDHETSWSSSRTNGAVAIMDPTTTTGPWYRSIVYDPKLTSTMVTRTVYAASNATPASLVIPGAGVAPAATDLFADPGLTATAQSLGAGTKLRLLAEAPPLPDPTPGFTRVIRVQLLGTDVTGYLPATAISPADSTPAKLYNFDAPGALVSPNGDYVHDTFHVIVRASEPLDGAVTITNGTGATVKTLTASDAWSVFDWDMAGSGGSLVPDGTYRWSYVGREAWGNNPTPLSASGTFILDTTVPSSSASTSGPLDPSGWYTGTATVTLSATDALSGVSAKWYTIDGGATHRYSAAFTIATSGSHGVRFWATDKAGNVEPTHGRTVKVDVTPPVTTAALSGPVGQAGFYRGDVTVTLSASDAQSGMKSTTTAVDGAAAKAYTAPVVVTAAGAHKVVFHSTDVTGRNEATKSVSFTIDRTVPSLGPDGTVVASTGQISPNGDGIAETVTIKHAMNEIGIVRMVVTPKAGGTAVRTLNVAVAAPGPGTVTWDGRNDAGVVVADGEYTVTLTPLDRARNAGTSQSVAVKVFSAFVGLTVAPPRFFPQDGDTIAPTTVAGFTLKSAADVQLKITDASGATVRTITVAKPAGAVALSWDGRNDAGAYVPQGVYRFAVKVSAGGLSEARSATVRAAAFELRPSVTTITRGNRLTLTVITTEPLTAAPRVTLRQPGRAAYTYTLTKVNATTYRVTFTIRTGGKAGTTTLTVVGTDTKGGKNSTVGSIRVR